MKEIHTFQLKEGINLHCIKETKFTAENISFFIQIKLSEKNAANAAVLSHILKYGCKNYPSALDINRKLQSLYGCKIDIFTFKNNCRLILCFNIEFVNKGNSISKIIDLAANILLCPLVYDGSFDENNFSRAVFSAEKNIRSLFDNNTSYARFRLFEEMAKNAFENETSLSIGISADGSLKEISKITPSSLYEFYRETITKSPIDIYFAGNENTDTIKNYFNRVEFADYARKALPPVEKLKGLNTVGRRKDEIKGLKQSILNIGYTFSEGNIYTAEILNELLSGGGNGILFNTVRQQNGLCYSISSDILPSLGILCISAGVDRKNIEQSISLINKAFENINKLSADDIKSAADKLIKNYNLIPDSLSKIISFCFSCRLNNIPPDIKKYTENLAKVTKEDITNLVSSIKEQVIYSLN